jgi:basic membrane protein A
MSPLERSRSQKAKGVGLLAILALSAVSARAADKIIFISPLPLGVDVYLKMSRVGTEMAGRELGAQTKTFESSDPETRNENLRAAIRERASIIVVTGFEFADLVPDFAEDNPGVKFLMVDQCTLKPAPNIYCVLFKEYEANFLAGAEAALTSQSGKVGAVAAEDIPFMRRYSDAFAAGARFAKPDIDVHQPLWVGGENAFADPLRAQSQAAGMAGDGVDRILAATSAGNGGIFKVASDAKTGVLAIGVDVNQCNEAPGHLLDSAMKHVDTAIARVVKAIAAGGEPAEVSYGLKEGGVGVVGLSADVAQSGCLIAGYPDVIARLSEIQSAIIDGRIVVTDPMVASR